MSTNLLKNKKNIYLLLLIFLIGIMLVLCSINLFHYTYEMDADIAADTQLGRLMWQYKAIKPASWIASTETILLCPSLLSSLIYGLTGNMNFSMGLSCSLMLCIIIFLLYRLCRNINFTPIASLLACITFLMLPGSTRNQQIICLFAAYYSVHIITVFLALISYIKIMRNPDKKYASAIICILFSLILAMQGMRCALVLTAPFFGMILLRELLFLIKYKHFSLKNKSYRHTFIFSVILIITSILGFFSPYSVPVDTSRNIRHALEKFIDNVLPAINDCLNLTSDNPAITIFNYIFIIITVVSLIIIIFLTLKILKNKKTEDKHIDIDNSSLEAFCIMFFFMSVLITIIMCTFTTTEVAPRYFFMYYLLGGLAIAYIFTYINNICKCISTALIIIYSVLIVTNYYIPVVTSNSTDNEIDQIVAFMEEHNCYYGYSSFSSAATLSVRSNDRIQVAALDNFELMNISKWQTDANWYVPNLPTDMPTAYIIHRSWSDDFIPTLESHPDIILIGETENYIIYYSDTNYSVLD